MMYLALIFVSYIVYGSDHMIHKRQGVMSNPGDDIIFDETDPIASSPGVQDLVRDIYERNVRRGLEQPATLSTSDKQAILDRHNQIRSETARGIYPGPSGTTQPKACNMNSLSWSMALEKIATDWSSQCYFEHSTGCASRMTSAINGGAAVEWNRQTNEGCGENLYVSGAKPALDSIHSGKNYGIMGGVDDGWCAGESILYTYSNQFNYAAGHYTQVVWANTRYVGCGFRECNGITTDSTTYTWGKLMFTCNYGPAGNYGGQYPYKKGEPCTCCDADRKICSHDGGLCGGGWNSNWNNGNSNADKSEPDRCSDGLNRYVCGDKVTPSPVNSVTPRPTKPPTTPSPVAQPLPPSKKATRNPTKKPTPNPSRIPTPAPTDAPSRARVTNAPTTKEDKGETRYAIRVSTEIIWLTYTYDFRDVETTIDDLLFGYLSEKYLGLEATTIDEDAKIIKGPYCADPCYYIYGFNTVPVILQGATESLKDSIVTAVQDGTFNDAICESLTAKYENKQDTGLRCYRVVGTVETITESEYQAFIGDLDNDGVPFDTLNLESYSGADIFVLLIFLSFICCACWCIGWYSHKKKFSKELEKELNLAANFNPQLHENDIRRQMAANNSPDAFERGIAKFRR